MDRTTNTVNYIEITQTRIYGGIGLFGNKGKKLN